MCVSRRSDHPFLVGERLSQLAAGLGPAQDRRELHRTSTKRGLQRRRYGNTGADSSARSSQDLIDPSSLTHRGGIEGGTQRQVQSRDQRQARDNSLKLSSSAEACAARHEPTRQQASLFAGQRSEDSVRDLRR
jgi:hypothetical protein